LRPRELAHLDEIVGRFTRERRRVSPQRHRRWQWNRGEVIRLALAELNRRTIDGEAQEETVGRRAIADRPTKPTSAELPPHGPGCTPMALASNWFEGEQRYVCAANCPRWRALAREAGS